jgi:ABC-type multidrug transport system ATPase subunit
MEEADRLCERLAIMDHGRLLALDTPEALKRTVGGDLIVRLRAGSEPDRVAAHLRDLDVVTGSTIVGETAWRCRRWRRTGARRGRRSARSCCAT